MVVIYLYFLEATGFDCGSAVVLKNIRFVWDLLDIILLIVPIGLILMVSFDFAKNVMAGKQDDMNKNLKIAIKRLLFAMVLFLTPTVVEFMVALLGDKLVGINFMDCVNIAINEDLSEYELKFDKDDYSDVPDYEFNRPPNYTIIEKEEEDSSSGNSANGGSGGASDNSTKLNIKDKSNLVAIMYSTWFDMVDLLSIING